MTSRRLIEETFPLKKVSEDSKHENTVNSVKVTSLHHWPAPRPLAASRAAILAALMPDPGDEFGRRELTKKIESITAWGTENGPALDYFRNEIRKAYGGRAPRVLDMFAGGGAIPLEAMRLGCDVTAIDYNPVAWFILKCTLEFPQKLAGKTWSLPDGRKQANKETGETNEPQQMTMLAEEKGKPGTLAEHVRYWGNWVAEQARAELKSYYPIVDGIPTVAYLWARSVPCPDPLCGAEVPLLRTLWICTKEEKTLPDTPENRARPDFLRVTKTRNTSRVVINSRRALRLIPNPEQHRVDFDIWVPGPKDDVPEGTMAGAKSRCPVCGVNLAPEYIKQCGQTGQMNAMLTTVVTDTAHGKDYRLPEKSEIEAVKNAEKFLSEIENTIPYGLPAEMQEKNPRSLIVQLYGMNTWGSLFSKRQLLSLSIILKWTIKAKDELKTFGYTDYEIKSILCYLGCVLDRLADHNSRLVRWMPKEEAVNQTFDRNVLAMTWDFSEAAIINDVRGGYRLALKRIISALEMACSAANKGMDNKIDVFRADAAEIDFPEAFDAIVTDPPYYDAIPYSDLSDFFYVWLRRLLSNEYPLEFSAICSAKDEELALRLPHADIPTTHTPEWFEDRISVAFGRAYSNLKHDGRMVIVFAHKDPMAWETLVAAMITRGFSVTASWPIDTEKANRSRAMNSAALSSSVWLVCKKRSTNSGVGRYVSVKKAMQERITERLRYFWDMGISGPDFVWAAVGPALESYSAYDEVRRMDGSAFTVGEFLREVRRMVADFALGQILKGQSTDGLDEWSRYYLMHRNLFGLEESPVGECILLSQGYGLDLNELRSPRGILVKASKKTAGEESESTSKSSGSGLRLAKWDERKRDDLGEPHPNGGLPLIDMLHRLTWLWASGETDKLHAYSDDNGLGQNELFWAVAQAILEMAEPKSRERTLLEALVAWGRGGKAEKPVEQTTFIDKGK